MTSGQGGAGPEQGGWPPPGRSPHGQAPSGRPPHGYVPAPPAPAGPPRERPLTVRAALGAFVAAILLGVASMAFVAADWDTYLRQVVAQQPQLGGGDPEARELAQATAESLAVVVVVAGVLFSALHLLVVWFAWTGRNWARIVLWVLGGFGVVSGLSGLAVGAALPSLTVLDVFRTGALIVGVVLLAVGPTNDWFRSEKWRRAVTGPR